MEKINEIFSFKFDLQKILQEILQKDLNEKYFELNNISD